MSRGPESRGDRVLSSRFLLWVVALWAGFPLTSLQAETYPLQDAPILDGELIRRGRKDWDAPGYDLIRRVCVEARDGQCLFLKFVIVLPSGSREMLNPYRFDAQNSAYLQQEFDRQFTRASLDGYRGNSPSSMNRFARNLINRRFTTFADGGKAKLKSDYFYFAANLIAQMQPSRFND